MHAVWKVKHYEVVAAFLDKVAPLRRMVQQNLLLERLAVRAPP